MNNKVGIFFSSDTGNTENVAKTIQKKIETFALSDIFNVSEISKKDILKYDKLLFGIPTWYYGEPQCDWDEFLPIFRTINFSRKKVAIFGCGDQEDYSEYFCDAMRILYEIVLANGATVIGTWEADGYYFEKSKSLIEKNKFLGLTIDEDRQPEMTSVRINNWVNQLRKEMNIFLS